MSHSNTSSPAGHDSRPPDRSNADSDDEHEEQDLLCMYLDFGEDEIGNDVNVNLPTAAVESKYIHVGAYDSMDQAQVALEQFNAFEYTYNTRYTSKNVTGVVYICRSYSKCPHRLKISKRGVGGQSTRYDLSQKGEHKCAGVEHSQHGIPVVHKSEIDSLLSLGIGATRVRTLLLHKCRNDPVLVSSIPEVRKVENRKETLKKNRHDGWEIDDFNSIDLWTHPRLCQTREIFDRAETSNFAQMNELIVLERFQHYSMQDGTSKPSIGLIMTSRHLFQNVRSAVTSQVDGLTMFTDGTYRIDFLGWTLVDCGGISVEWEKTHHVHRFRPWLYMFVRSECTLAYEEMFKALAKYDRLFLDIDVTTACDSIDHRRDCKRS